MNNFPVSISELKHTTSSGSRAMVSSSSLPNPLPIGHVVQEYVIEGLIGEGGFGIVYLARDRQLDRRVALKEYMPNALAMRGPQGHVVLRSERDRDTFELGLRSFVNEAQLLAAFDQPSLVKVYRFWEENDTAYMLMPFYEGPTLKQWVRQNGPPPQAWLLGLVCALTEALEIMHGQRCYHRDIAPDNILLLGQDLHQALRIPRPLLLDFGAARRVISDSVQTLTVILKPGYAPIEQYAESSSMKQGPWTDVYALCAVLYAAITGKAPQPSPARVVHDEMPAAVVAGLGRYTPEFLGVIDHGLAIRPDQRPATMAQLKAQFEALDSGADVAPPAVSSFTTAASPASASVLEPIPMPMVSLRPPTSSSRQARYVSWVGGLVVTCVFVGVLTLWLLPRANHHVENAPAPALPSPPTPAPSAASAPQGSVWQDLLGRADTHFELQARAEKTHLTPERDKIVMRVKSAEPGYLYAFLSTPDQSQIYVLPVDQNSEPARRQWRLSSPGPAGLQNLAIMVSKVPRDFPGLKPAGEREGLTQLDAAQIEQLWHRHENPLLGTTVCAPSPQPCDDTYALALLQINEFEPARAARKPRRSKPYPFFMPGDEVANEADSPNTSEDPDTEIRTRVEPNPTPAEPAASVP